MVIKCPRKYKIHVKAKKGQLLILTLIVMAIGLIVISPLLRYLDSSYTQYLHELNRTNAYYAADAMMENILNDVSRGIDVYNQNASTPYSHTAPYLDGEYGVNVVVVINSTVLQSLDKPQGSTDWIYYDPGITICNTSSCDPDLLLGQLAYGRTHTFRIYVLGGNQVQVNWAMDDKGMICSLGVCSDGPICPGLICHTRCLYHVGGSMWMLDRNGVKIPLAEANGSETSKLLHLNFSYSVPVGESGNYTIVFSNTGCNRSPGWPLFAKGCDPITMPADARPSHSEPFVAVDDTNFTWVRVGNESGGVVYSYQDYIITATATRNNQPVLSITAIVRHSPGPQAYWKDQIVEIPSWQVKYY